ncbi:cation-transporting P-type ATPase [Candidatus Micrarchaeota archaeon]|nr:cation-transporting P-type ATPase [Candidatus Micrarchaeota archaeon]MBU1682080.1 cation-transporting P-type ATPase [Candidatus Micrarchaeota archaeon]
MDWHSISLKAVFSSLKTSKSGLTSTEAKTRLESGGPNTISIKKEISPVSIFINQFKNLLVLLLLFAAFVSFMIAYLDPHESDYIDAILIFAIVIGNALFGFFQEYKAEKTIEALTKMSAPLALVIRDKQEIEIPSEQVVAGDILVITEGDKVAADARVIESFSIHSDESALTGESLPSQKEAGEVAEKTSLAVRSNMLFMNSVITRGRGLAVVVETGLKTEVGQIAKQISEAPQKVTQFQLETEDVGKKVSMIVVLMLVLIAMSKFLLGDADLLVIFTTAVALGVAAIPEGLPAVVTLALSIATNRMLKQNALMRKLSTIQDLGSVDVICTDKTGTLTENVMTVTRAYALGNSFEITGAGLAKSGEFVSKSGTVKDLDLLLKCAVLCNDSKENGDDFRGDPTELAVLIPAYKAGYDVDKLRADFKRIDEVPFSSDRKLMSTLNQNHNKKYGFVKGAPEVLITKCTSILTPSGIKKLTEKERENLLNKNIEMAGAALRVLGFAYKENPKSATEADLESNLIFLGLMGMRDPPREGVHKAIDDCRAAGIRVIMITGDNKYTAEAIGKELGFKGTCLTGLDLDELSEKEFSKTVETHDIYARTSPKHKVMLLKALQNNNHIVCMTGDGVNDAAAIKNSDVGIAMGIRGTEVTKQASDVIILDDNFISIRNAISEGRGTFINIRKFVTLLLGANMSEVLAVFIASITFLGLGPKIAIQLLWINLLTDGLPALALGADPATKNIMDEKPRPKGERILNGQALYFILWMGVIEALAVIAIYAYYHLFDDITKAYTTFFTAFVVYEMISVYLVRSRYKTPILSNKWLHLTILLSLALQLYVLYGGIGHWFGVVPLTLSDWILISGVGIIFIAVMWLAMAIEPVLKRKFLRKQGL